MPSRLAAQRAFLKNQSMNNLQHNYISSTKKLPAFIFREFSSYNRKRVEVVCPHCLTRHTHGKTSLDVARGCDSCGKSYYITPAPHGWTPPPAPFQITDVGEHPAKYGLVDSSSGGLVETAEPGTEQFWKQQRWRLKFQGWSDSAIKEIENRQRDNFRKLEEMEKAEKRKRIINSRPGRQDVSHLKSSLSEYLRRKGVHRDPKTGLYRCPNHADENPSAILYDKQAVPILYCPVCGVSMDIFNVAGLLTGTSDFKMLISEVKKTLGVIS